MIALLIKDHKLFMQKILGSETFDSFYLEEATITTYNTFHIDGHTHKAFYKDLEENIPEFSTWGQLRPLCYQMVKGTRTPLSFRFTLHAGSRYLDKLKEKEEAKTHAHQIKALAVNIRFDAGELKCITGTAYSEFVLDKTIEHIWDEAFLTSLTAMGIQFELLL